MEQTNSTEQIIEKLKQSARVGKTVDIEDLRKLSATVQEGMELTEEISQIENPQELEKFINATYQTRKGNLSKSELEILVCNYIRAKIELGEYKEANQILRQKLAKDLQVDYGYYIDMLIHTERKLGHIRLAKELATIALSKNPEHVTPRNELIHIALMEGDKQTARELIQQQNLFYAKKRSLPTMAIRSYLQDEEETKKLESLLDGLQISK